MADDGKSWVEKQSGISAPKSAEFANPNLRDSGSWVSEQSGISAPERAKSYSERVEPTTVYGGVLELSRSAYEVDYSSRSYDDGGDNLPFQISGSGNSWSVSGGYINQNKVDGVSASGRSFEVWIDVINKKIVTTKNDNGLYVPVGKVVNAVAESWLTSNIITSKDSNKNSDGTANNCPFYYWGV